jgi:hypothetical protein
MICGGNSQDYPYLPYPSPTGTQYFTESELALFPYINQKANPELIIYGDYETSRDKYSIRETFTREILTDADINNITDGYLILRSGELRKRGGLTFSHDRYGGSLYRYYKDQANIRHYIDDILIGRDNIYNSGDIELYRITNIKK